MDEAKAPPPGCTILVTLLDGTVMEARHRGVEDGIARTFVLQATWCMFAEDLGQIPGHRFTRVLEGLIANPDRSSADDLGRFFEYLDDPYHLSDHMQRRGPALAGGAMKLVADPHRGLGSGWLSRWPKTRTGWLLPMRPGATDAWYRATIVFEWNA